MERAEVGSDALAFLRSLDVFRSLTEDGLDELAHACREEEYEGGTVMFREGDRADNLYIVVAGEVEVWKDYGSDEEEIIALLGAGRIFGEMALVDKQPRSATIVTRTAARLLAVAEEDFQNVLRRNPTIALSLQRLLATRVRRSTERFFDDLKERNRELEKALKELRRVQDELISQERLSTVGKFASLILHDIRRPITSVMAYADLLLRRDDLPAEARDFAGNIRSSTRILDDMAREMLDYSRGDIRLEAAAVDVEDFLADLEKNLRGLVLSREVDLEIRSTCRGSARFDRERMNRVFYNLAENAVKSMGRSGRLSITAEPAGDFLIFRVTDTGEGMDGETLQRIFEPFFSSSSRGGTGLGMVAVKNIVEAHGGTVAVDSAPSGGTTVKITLPARG